MALDVWGSEDQNPLSISSGTGTQTNPSVADNGGAEFSVAWIDGSTIRLSFFDEQGISLAAVAPTVTVTDGVYAGTGLSATISDVHSIVGGTGIGYGILWEESAAGQPDVLRFRFYNHVTSGLFGGEVAVSDGLSGLSQHDAAISNYTQDGANNRPTLDGFDVTWVESNGGAHSLGAVYVQRFAVPLDAANDPTAPPQAAGIDGVVGNGADGQVLVAASGRDPSVAGLLGDTNETVVTWIDASNNINIRIYNDTGTINNAPLGVATTNVNSATFPISATGQQHVMALPGGGFVLAWVSTSGGNSVLAARIFVPGAAPGTFAATPVITLDTLDGDSNNITDFSLSALTDTGGFSVSWNALHDPDGAGGPLTATQAVFVHAFSPGGLDLGATVVHGPADATGVSTTGLVGDRIVTVYQDNSVDGGDIGAQIVDTRVNQVGDPIVINERGVTLNGDAGGVAPDVLVGTIGNDLIDGAQDLDLLDGGLGNDRIIAGAGSDTIDGGGNGDVNAPGGTLSDGTVLATGGDTVVFTGSFLNDGIADANDDYDIQDIGGGLFQVTDLRAGSPDGVDFISNVEFFEFQGNAPGTQVLAVTDLFSPPPVTPSAWGWTDSDLDNAPNTDGAPDVDGFLVNHAAAGNGAVDTNAFVADSVGEFFGVVWQHSENGGPSHIQGQFYDVIGAFDGFMPNVVNLSDGIGIETNAVVTSGGANSGWGVAWEELDNVADVSHTIRTNFQGPGFLTGPEITVFNEGPLVDQHDAAMFGSFLDRTLDSPEGGSVLPTGMNEGYNVVWVSTHLDGADGTLPEGYGRIMLQRFEAVLDDLGNPGAPVAGGIDGIVGLDNVYGTGDAAVWVGNEAAGLDAGAFGRNPSTAALHTFETGIIWIEQDGAGGERVAFRALDDLGQVIDYPAGNNISAGFPNFGIAWITPDATSPSGYTVMATMLSSAGAGLNGENFSFGAPSAPFEILQLPAGFDPANSDFHVSGLSGEDSNDLAISWSNHASPTDVDMMLQHIAVTLDPVTGVAIGMQAEGDYITVNAETAGIQSGGTIAGMLGDRVFAVYSDDNPTYTDGSDIVGRIIDTRDAVTPDPIVGDLIQPGGGVQARRDVLIGTNGDDNIRGDISNSDGLVDYIFSGMGNDTIQGGPGLRGAAGIPEIIDGGEGNDTSVYTGRLQDYSITVNGDGSIEVIDLRPTGQGTLNHDGIDNLFNIENLKFLDLSNGGAGAQTITLNFPGQLPPIDPSFNGTPVAWSLSDETPFKEIVVDVDPTPGTAADQRADIAVTNLQDGAGLAWSVNGNQVWAISYDNTGLPDPVLLDINRELTSGAFTANTVSDIDITMTGGLGLTAVWESTTNLGDSSIHLAFASTNTHVVLDPGGGVPGPGLPGGEIVVVGTDGAGFASDPTIKGYEIVDGNNDTLEIGFHVGFVTHDDGVLDTSIGDAYGALTIARYEIPVYDILVDAAGAPILDGAGQGQLDTDIFGNLIPSTAATFGVGSETAPISIGLDGLRGTADDNAAIVVTNQGLFAANAVPGGAQVIQGRELSMGSLHDGQLVVSYIGSDEQVHLRIYLPSINETADRETTGLGGVDVVATGVTSYAEFTPPFSTTLGAVAPGQSAMTVAQQNGSFGVFWAGDDGAGGIAIKGVIYTGAGTNWAASPVITFESGLPANVSFDVAPTGVTPGGLEDGFFVSWESGAGISGQRFDMAGVAVGDQMVVGDPTSGTPGAHSTAGIDDGRMIVGYVNGDNVSAQYLDNRQSGVTLIGPRSGAPADVIAGTVGDDAIDGRALDDQLFGGLGDDLITMGSGADIGFGGVGDDTIIGGGGQDQLLGEAGNDLLWGGLSGPIDPQVNRDLEDGLTAAGVSAALIATNPGADIISGGAGEDTISYQGEFGSFNIDLTTGIVRSDRDNNGSFILEDVIGQIDTVNGTFNFTGDVENATGGLGNDTFTGNGGANVFIGGGGTDTVNGAGGTDTVVFSGAFASFTFLRSGANLTITRGTESVTVSNVEFLQFNGTRTNVATLNAALTNNVSTSGASLSIANANTGPIAANDAASVAQGHTIVLKPVKNDTDADGGQKLSVISVEGNALTVDVPVAVSHGVVTLLSNGALAFTASSGFVGTASLAYVISDGSGGTATANLNIDITSTNDGAAPLSISGVAKVGNLLSAVLGADPDGAGINPPTYQWFADGVAIGGATGATYTLIQANGGKVITVQASYVDGAGFSESVISAPTKPVGITLIGTPNPDPLNGLAGDDTISGLGANDTITGNGGNDVVDGGSGADTIFATINDGDDTYNGGGGPLDVYDLSATTADAFVNLATGVASSLQTGLDTLIAIERVTGGAGDDTLFGDAQDNLLIGGGGNDTLSGGTAGVDTLRGGLGNDTYIIDRAGVTFVENVGEGTDTIRTSLGVFALTGQVENLTFTGVGAFTGTGNGLDNVITGGTSNDVLSGLAGIDTLNGGLGADTLDGGSGADIINGGAGNDVITYAIDSGPDAINGGADLDTVNIVGTGAANILDVTFNGSLLSGIEGGSVTGVEVVNADFGAGIDTLIYTGAAAVTVNLGLGTASGFTTITGLERVTGGDGNDTITGDAQINLLVGGLGNDTLDGGSAGTDSLRGGAGNDTYIINRTDVAIVENLDDGIDTIVTTLATRTLGANLENLTYVGGGNFNGTGNGFDNVMTGAGGADTLNGGVGRDTLNGGGGADTLLGAADDDILNGGAGDDSLNGGQGNDHFVLTPGFGHDTIIGFDANPTDGQDLIDLTALGITAATFASHVVITDLGADMLITIDGTDSVTLLNVSGTGAFTVNAGDFILAA